MYQDVLSSEMKSLNFQDFKVDDTEERSTVSRRAESSLRVLDSFTFQQNLRPDIAEKNKLFLGEVWCFDTIDRATDAMKETPFKIEPEHEN